MASRSQTAEALAVLDGSLPASLAASDVAVQKSVIEGATYRIAQDFEKSDRALSVAEELAASQHVNLLPKVLIERGALEIDRGNYPKAREAYARALQLSREQHNRDQEAAALVNMARLAMSEERFDDAIDQNRKALEFSRSLGKRTFVATSLGNMGWAYFDLGDFDNALTFFRQGAELSELLGLNGYSAYWYTGVANTYVALHDYASAEELSKRTLERARTLRNGQTVAECLNTLAEIGLKDGRLDDAAKYNQEATKLEEEGNEHFGVLQSLILSGRIETRRRNFPEAERLFRKASADPNAEAALRWELRARMAELHDAEGRTANADREYRQAINTIEKVRQSIMEDALRVSFLSGGIAIYDEYVDFLVAHGRPQDALKVAELSRARTLEEGLGTTAQAQNVKLGGFRPEEVAQRLKATLLFYWLGEQHSYLWVITPANTVSFTLPPEKELDSLVRSYRDALQGTRDPLESANADGQKLFSILVEPARKLIPAHSRVIVLPDGSLYGLNFETLIVPGPKPHYWIEDVTLSTGSSLSLLASAAARPAPKEKTLYLVGDTIPPNDNFPKLTQAAEEMKSIEKYFPASRTKTLSGAGATPSAYLDSNPQRYSYIHFVTHGTASRARPLESAVILSKEQGNDSYKLYARDILKRRLSAALVTISACNTSGTRTFSGEGLVGLSWAFLRAGAHNVIGALWEVSDTATPQLMNTLYDGLSHGKDPAAALRDAQLSLLHSDSVFRKARYWAPFQLYVGS